MRPAVGCVVGLLLVAGLTACSGEDDTVPPVPPSAVGEPVVLPPADPALTQRDRDACAALLGALPATLSQQDRGASGDDPEVATWGDPPIQLRCGVASPAGFDPTAVPGQGDPAPCAKVSGVGWWVPPDQVDGDGDALLTAVTYQPRVAVLVPQTYLPEGSAAALAELADPVKQHLRRSLRCG